MQPDKSNASEGSLIWIAFFVIFVIPIFVVIWNGYHGFWSDQLPNLDTKVHLSAATVTSLVIWAGSNIVSRYKLMRAGAPEFYKRNAWVVPYAILFVVGGLGIFNFAYQTIEGKFILKEKIEEVDAALLNLNAKGSTAISDSLNEYNTYKNTIAAKLDGLRREIYNNTGKATCGIGGEALRLIDEIRRDLPGFHRLAGHMETKCSNRDALDAAWEAHRTLGTTLLEDSPRTLRADVPGKARLSTELERTTRTEREKLGAVRTQLLEGSQLLLDPATMQKARDTINKSAHVYAEMFSRVNAIAPVPLQARIDVSESENLGRTTQSIWSALGRSSNGRVVVYLLGALLLDFFVVLVIQKLNESLRARQARRPVPPPSNRPNFIWTKPTMAAEAT